MIYTLILPLRQVFNDFVAFLKSPKEESEPERSAASKLKHICLLYLVELPVLLAFVGIINVIDHYKLADIGGHISDDFLIKFSYASILFLTVIVAPLMEEIIFRLPLKYQRNYFFRWMVWCISKTGLVEKDKLQQGVQKFWKASFVYFFYGMAITFGLIHLMNFTNAKSLILLAPLLTFTQLFGGLIIGYIRVKIGFMWGVGYHAAHNFLAVTLTFLFITSFTTYHFKNNKAIIDIIRSEGPGNTLESVKSSKVTPQEIQYKHHNVREIIASLTSSNEKYIITNGILFRYDYDITSTYANHQSRTDSARNMLLSHLQKAFGLKIERKMINKEAWELYVADSTRIQTDTTKNDLFELNGNLRSLGAHLDRRYKHNFVFSSDTVHRIRVKVPAYVKFEDLPVYLNNKYGLGLRKVNREIEFINIDLAETVNERTVI